MRRANERASTDQEYIPPGEEEAYVTLGFGVGLPPSDKAVISAYREAARRLHPDRGGDPVAFVRLQTAYSQIVAARKAANGSFGESGEAEASTLLQVPVRRGNQGLGLVVDDQNIITELTPGGPAERDGQLVVGDVVVAVDGEQLYDAQRGATRKLKDVMSIRKQGHKHTFTVRRAEGQARAGPTSEPKKPTAAERLRLARERNPLKGGSKEEATAQEEPASKAEAGLPVVAGPWGQTRNAAALSRARGAVAAGALPRDSSGVEVLE